MPCAHEQLAHARPVPGPNDGVVNLVLHDKRGLIGKPFSAIRESKGMTQGEAPAGCDRLFG